MEKKSHAAQVNYMAAHEQLCVLNYLPQIKGNGWTSCRLPKKKKNINHTNHPCMNLFGIKASTVARFILRLSCPAHVYSPNICNKGHS